MKHLALIFSYFQSKMLLNVVSKSPHIHIRVQVIGRINGRFKRSESDQMEGIGEIIKKKKKKQRGGGERYLTAVVIVERLRLFSSNWSEQVM